MNTYSSRIGTKKLDNIASLTYKQSYDNPGSNNNRLGLSSNRTELSLHKMSPHITPAHQPFSSYFDSNSHDVERQNYHYRDQYHYQTTENEDLNLSSEICIDSQASQHHLNNKIYKAFKLAKKQDSERFKLHLNQTELAADHCNSEKDPGSQSFINSTEERSTKRRVCLRSKSVVRASHSPLPSIILDSQQDIPSLKSTHINSLSNQALSDENNNKGSHPATLLSTNFNKEENYLSCNLPKPINIPSRAFPSNSQDTLNSIQYTDPNERVSTNENLNNSQSQNAKPAIKHRILLQSSSKKRERSSDSLNNITSQSPKINEFAPSLPTQNILNQLDAPKMALPSSGFWTFSHYNSQDNATQKQNSIHQNAINFDLNNSRTYQETKNDRNYENYFKNKDLPINFGSSRRQRQSLSEEKNKETTRQLSMPPLHINNFSHIDSFRIQNSGSSKIASKLEEDRIIPLRDIVRKKHEEYKAKLQNLIPYSSTNSENTKGYSSEVNKALYSAERKNSFESLNLPLNQYESNFTYRPDLDKNDHIQGAQIKEENRVQYHENCQNVLSDINSKIEGILQKCCELTERSVKGLEKLSTGNIGKQVGAHLIDRTYTSPRLNITETGRDTFREEGKIKIGKLNEDEIELKKVEKHCWSGTSKDEFIATLEKNELLQNEGLLSQRLWMEEEKELEDLMTENKCIKLEVSDKQFDKNQEVDRISEEDEEFNETYQKESKIDDEEKIESAKTTNRREKSNKRWKKS